jgi:CRISPR-associated protein Cas2
MNRALYLFCYDISEPRRRCAVHRLLSGFRVEGQKSVFECLLSAGELEGVVEQLPSMIDPTTDRVHIVRLDPRLPKAGWGVASMHEAGKPLMVT